MIQQVLSYLVGDKLFPCIEEAQSAEIYQLLIQSDGLDSEAHATKAAQLIVAHADEVIAILSGKPRTKKPRSDKGTKRAPKAAAVAS
jgi:ABC-type uncharacterized transport system auxiliary subunit